MIADALRRVDPKGPVHIALGNSFVTLPEGTLLGEARLDRDGPLSWRFAVKEQPDDAAIEARFLEMCRSDLNLEEADFLPLTALLFFAMLPRHGDRPDLQRKLLASGLIISGRAGLSS